MMREAPGFLGFSCRTIKAIYHNYDLQEEQENFILNPD